MLFEDFVEQLNESPLEGIDAVCKKTRELLAQYEYETSEWSDSEHKILWEACSLINLTVEYNYFVLYPTLPMPTTNINRNCQELIEYINRIEEIIKSECLSLDIEKYKNLYSAQFNKAFAYEFSSGDLNRIQELIGELRIQITNFKDLDDKHRARLLSRLEKLQSELHKRVSDLDRFWGLIGDAGVVLGKFGTDAKPLVDRIVEISKIAWNTQARAEELPSDVSNPLIDNSSVL